MPTTITSAGITFNDATTLTSAVIPANAVGATQIADGSVTAAKLGTTEQKQIAKAWVNFNGTTSPGTIRSSYNVSSVTKSATGNYTVNFTTPMSDSNYTVTHSSAPLNTTNQNYFATRVDSYANSSFRVLTPTAGNTTLADYEMVSLTIFGN